jgi:hypothetical protein
LHDQRQGDSRGEDQGARRGQEVVAEREGGEREKPERRFMTSPIFPVETTMTATMCARKHSLSVGKF